MYGGPYSFLELHDDLFSLQFGFQKNHSIDHALVSLTETVKNTLDNKRFGCSIFIDLQKLLILLIIKFYYRNWNTMVFGDVLLSGLGHILLIESSMFLLMVVILTYFQLHVVYHKVLYRVHYFFLFTLMIYQMLVRNLTLYTAHFEIIIEKIISLYIFAQ